MLFDESFYIQINEARWVVAERVLVEIRDRCGVKLATCLDVGCGPGWFSKRLSALGLDVEGLDGRGEIIQEAKRRAPEVLFHDANIESEAAIASLGPYDLVFCFGLLYHTENPFRVIRNLRRLTKKILFIESIVIPGSDPCAWLVAENPNETQGLTFHSLIPSRTCLLKMLQASGFEHMYEYSGNVEHEDFEETETRYRRRMVFLVSFVPLSLGELVPVPEIAAPKYDFTRRS